MGADQHHNWQDVTASALDWWRDAGVDTIVDEVPFAWRKTGAPPPPPTQSVSQRQAPEPAIRAPLPAILTDFIAWRAGPEAPEAAWGKTPIIAEGDPASELMIVIDCPDSEGLIDGAAGTLFERMLAAIGRDRSDVYLAPLATARPIAGRIPPEDLPRLAELLRHHVKLAAPKRLLIVGSAVSRALIGMDAGPGRGSLHAINLDGVIVDGVTSFTPRFLLERPSAKAEAWKDLLLLTGGLR